MAIVVGILKRHRMVRKCRKLDEYEIKGLPIEQAAVTSAIRKVNK